MSVRPCLAAALAAIICSHAHADLPPGFTRTFIAGVDEVGSPTCLVALPDNRVITGDYFGYISLVQLGQPVVSLMALDDVWWGGDHGLLGMALDPDFANNGYLYMFYTQTGPYDVLVRYTFTGAAIDQSTRTIIWRNPDLCTGDSHHGGAINFGPDGHLYITTGDQFDNAMNAQDLTNQHGKILRLEPDGGIPDDNPFINTPGVQAAIWVYGLRNPFHARMDYPTNSLFIGDVGESTWEEVDRLSVSSAAGANLGWPYMEGPLCNVPDCSPFTAPVFSYSHLDPVYASGRSACVIVGPVYRGTMFPDAYRNNLFVADYANGWIRRFPLDASGNITDNIVFDSGPSAGRLTDMVIAPDGSMYYTASDQTPVTDIGLYRITATGGNQPPVVVVNGSPARVDLGTPVHFSSDGTFDPDNSPQPLSYLWNFGDGQTSTLPNPDHTYAARGRYLPRLTVSDGADPVISDPITIIVGHAPVPTIITPAPNAPYRAGDHITFSGSATDAEDGALPPSAFSWSITLVHLTHTHHVVGPFTGVTSGGFDVPTSGHDPEDTHLRVDLTVTDSDGTPATVSTDLSPVLSPIQFDSQPSGIPVFIDGRALQTPRTYESIVGFHHVLAAQNNFSLNGINYTFSQWDGGQPLSFSFVSPDGGTSFTAIYTGCGTADFNCDGDVGTDADIEDFFACIAGNCPAPPCPNSADFNNDGDVGTDADIEAFFRVLGGGAC